MNKRYILILSALLGIMSNALCMEGQRPDDVNGNGEQNIERPSGSLPQGLVRALAATTDYSNPVLVSIYYNRLGIPSDAPLHEVEQRCLAVFNSTALPSSLEYNAAGALYDLLIGEFKKPQEPEQEKKSLLEQFGVSASATEADVHEHFGFLNVTGQMSEEKNKIYGKLLQIFEQKMNAAQQEDQEAVQSSAYMQQMRALPQARAMIPFAGSVDVNVRTTHTATVRRDAQGRLVTTQHVQEHRRIEEKTDSVEKPVADTHPNFNPDNGSNNN